MSFAEYGYEGASLRAIADNAGVSFQLIAYYFGSKEELWVATVDYLVRALSRDRQGSGVHAVRQPARAVPQSLAAAADRHAAAAAAAQDLRAGVPGEQRALPQRHSRRSSSTCSRRSRCRISGGRAARHRRALHRRRDLLVLVVPSARPTSCRADFVEHTWGCRPAPPKAVEQQVDLMFAILTEKLSSRGSRAAEPP